MYQTIIRDPGGGDLVRICPDISGSNYSVVNGSILIVPPGTVAFVSLNGNLSSPYSPGRYQIFTGVDPLFVRFRNVMTCGDAGVSVAVFFISINKCQFLKLGTGELPFKEHRFNITMKALASCSLSFSINNPKVFLSRLIGSYNYAFTGDDIAPCIEQLILGIIRESLSKELAKLEVTEFNSHLSDIANNSKSSIQNSVNLYGMRISHYNLLAINVPEQEVKRLYELEKQFAEGKTRTDIEFDQLSRIWNGNIDNRTMSEMLTGIPSRGQANSIQNNVSNAENTGGMMPMMMQMMMMSQMLPVMRDNFTNVTNHTDMFRNTGASAQTNTSNADSPPPIPGRNKRCPSCNGMISHDADVCPICGYRFN